jgi:hypothetical protein
MGQKIFVLIMLIVAIGCKDSSNTTVVNSGSDITGTLKGLIMLYDSSGQLVSDKSGVRIELVGTNFSAVTDTGGLWVIENLPSRTYDLKFSKAGYSTIMGQISFLGGSTLWYGDPTYPLQLSQPAVFTITLDAVISPRPPIVDSFGINHKQYGTLFYHYSKNAPGYVYVNGMIISGHNASLDLDNPSSYEHLASGMQQYKYTGDSVLSGQIGIGYLQDLTAGFVSGETIYFRAYPYVREAQYYFDYKTFTKIYVGYGAGSNVLSITLP